MTGPRSRRAPAEEAGPAIPFPLVVLDWDGTVVDSVAAIVRCTAAAASAAGLPDPDPDAVRCSVGLGLAEALATFAPGLSPAETRRLLECYRACWVEEFHAWSEPFPGVLDALDELERRGHLLTVATGKSRRGLRRDWERLGLEARFVASRTADETASKPHPAMLEELMDELGARPRDTVLVGDTIHDLEMASNAGVAAVAVLCGASSHAALAAFEPLAMLPSLAHLPAWLERYDGGRPRSIRSEPGIGRPG